MANIGQQEQKALLDYINRGFTSNLPAAWFVALSTGNPGTLAGAGVPGELPTALGHSRQTCQWGAAAGTPSTANNLNAMTFGPFSSINTISGIGVVDSSGPNTGAGNGLWLGTLQTVRITQPGDSLILAASALTSQIN